MSRHHVIPFFLLLSLVTVNASAESQETPQYIAAMEAKEQTAPWAQYWWLKRHRQMREDIQKQNVDMLWIGDSLMQKWQQQGLKVWQRYYQHRDAFNIGMSGDRTENVLWRLQNGAMNGVSPRLVVLMIGANNSGLRSDSAKETFAGIKAIVAQIQSLSPASKILLLDILPRGNFYSKLRLLNERVNKKLPTLADNKSVFHMRLNRLFLGEDGNVLEALMPDGIHLSEKGYELWAKSMEPTLKRLMN